MEFDERLAKLGISVVATADATWVVSAALYQDEKEAGGKHHVYFTVVGASGQPLAGITCVVDWIGRETNDKPTKVVTDTNGKANVPLYANLDITLLNGPYFAFVEDESKSEVVRGMGLPEKRHVNFMLTFAPPQVTAKTLPEAAVAAAAKLTWMPINTGAALYQFAQANKLGYPQTDEFEYVYGADTYVAQVFNLGIVYVKKDDWGNCKWIKKPEA